MTSLRVLTALLPATLILTALAPAAGGQTGPVPLGDEILISNRPGPQENPKIAVSSFGDFAVAWESTDTLGAFEGIFFQVFDSFGNAVVPESRVHGSAPAHQSEPAVVFDGLGFLVLWSDGDEPGRRTAMRGRRYTRLGMPLDEVQVLPVCPPAEAECSFDSPARLARGSNGRVPAAWITRDDGTGRRFVQLAFLMADGTVEIRTIGEGESLSDPAVASDTVSQVAVAWQGDDELLSRRFDLPSGEPITPSVSLALERGPELDLALALDGQLVAAWQDPGEAAGVHDDAIFVRRYRRFRPLGEPFLVPGVPFGQDSSPALAGNSAGHFVAAWERLDTRPGHETEHDVFVRRFNKAWGPAGGEIRAHSLQDGDQRRPDVAFGSRGDFMVVWEDRESGDSNIVARRFGPFTCVAGEHALCLQNDRFRLEVAWRDFSGNTGTARASHPLTRDTGYFWFFNRDNVEIVVKVLDGRHVNGSYWVFYGALSNVGYTVTVTDTMTGVERRYVNPPGQFASLADDAAFPDDEIGWGSSAVVPAPPEAFAAPTVATETDEKQGSCVAQPSRLCLANGRFELTMRWRDFIDQTGNGRAVPLTNDTGYFWFFADFNVEVVVKILDGRAINGNYWVFFGGLSTVEYSLTIRDTVTGNVREYFNPIGRSASAGDVNALPGG